MKKILIYCESELNQDPRVVMQIKTLINEYEIYTAGFTNSSFATTKHYTIKKNRNYKIHCVKYEIFFKKIEEFNKILNLPNLPQLYPSERTTKREYKYEQELHKIYEPLLDKINKMNFITII